MTLILGSCLMAFVLCAYMACCAVLISGAELKRG